MWKVVTSSNLNPPLKIFFYSLILANNNLLLKIYCENIVVAFLNCHFLFFILFFLSISSIRTFFFLFLFLFFSFFFSPPHMYTHFSSLIFLFLFLLDSRIFSNSLCDKKQRKNKQEISCLLHCWSKDTGRRRILLAPPLLTLSPPPLFFFFFASIVMIWLILKIVFFSLYFDYAWV